MENIGDLFEEQTLRLSIHLLHLAGPPMKVSMAVFGPSDSMCASSLAKSRTILCC